MLDQIGWGELLVHCNPVFYSFDLKFRLQKSFGLSGMDLTISNFRLFIFWKSHMVLVKGWALTPNCDLQLRFLVQIVEFMWLIWYGSHHFQVHLFIFFQSQRWFVFYLFIDPWFMLDSFCLNLSLCLFKP